MFFGVWNSARANKANILYAIVTVFLLERVRTGWNRLESVGRRHGLGSGQIEKKQKRLVVGASLLYALPLLLPVIKYIYRSIEELSWSVPGLLALKNAWAFWGLVFATECFLALIIYNLLVIYVDRMNAAVGFFKAIGRNVRDGSMAAVQASSNVGTRAWSGVRRLPSIARGTATTATRTAGRLVRWTGAVTLPRRIRSRAVPGADNLEGSRS